MSQPSYCEARAESLELAREICARELGRDPTEIELDEMYEILCDKYRYG